MTYQTHAYFGAELFRVLSDGWDVPLSKKRLVAGSVKPDVSSLRIVLHYVADFFTAVHNITPNRLKDHLAFEERLHEQFLRYVRSDTTRRCRTSTRSCSPA
jgi:hypothetical protein